MNQNLDDPPRTPEDSADEPSAEAVEITTENPYNVSVASGGDTSFLYGAKPVENPSKAEFDFLKFLTIGVIIALFIGFATVFVAVGVMWLNSIATRSATYQNLVNQITVQNTKMDFLLKEFDDLEMRHSTSTH